MLEVREISASYGDVPVLHDVSFQVGEGEIVSIVGSNGAGKSTILRTISGLLQPDRGEMSFCGTRIDRREPHEIVKMGIAHVPEGRRLFNKRTVWENLYLGAYVSESKAENTRQMEWVFDVLPILRERKNQRAGTLSGGEQQMLAIGRGLMSRPKLLLMDECSLGLQPTIVTRVFELVSQLHREGMTILLVEQRVHEALELAHRAYVLQTGRIILEGTGRDLLQSDLVRKAYLGM
jgi:branched-chain amino acid transport system ATP-binding protein